MKGYERVGLSLQIFFLLLLSEACFLMETNICFWQIFISKQELKPP